MKSLLQIDFIATCRTVRFRHDKKSSATVAYSPPRKVLIISRSAITRSTHSFPHYHSEAHIVEPVGHRTVPCLPETNRVDSCL